MTLKDIQKLIKDFEDSELTELELELNDVKLRLSKNKNNEIKYNVEKENIEENEETPKSDTKIAVPLNEIKSPLVGTFYDASSPEVKPFVEVGDLVKEGDVVCIIEAMKIMNEITSNVSGVINSINFKNGDVVGFDDALFTVKVHANTSK